MGVIDNDFHNRKDLTPNICAVYTEKEYRNKGIAGHLLNIVVDDLKRKGITLFYLVTDYTGFYEKYVVPLTRAGYFSSIEEDTSDTNRWNTPHARKNRRRFEEVCRNETHSDVDGLSTVLNIYEKVSEARAQFGDFEYFKVVIKEK